MDEAQTIFQLLGGGDVERGEIGLGRFAGVSAAIRAMAA